MTIWSGAAVLAVSFLAAAPVAASGAADALAASQWRSRVLLVLAADPHDPKLARQRTIFSAMQAGARDRDLKLVEAVGSTPEAAALRKRFDVQDGGFHAILIGKDGGDKLSSAAPLAADRLFPLIDAMPMRQEEMRRGPD